MQHDNDLNECPDWSECENRVREELKQVPIERQEEIWNAFLELLLEVMEACLKDGSWIPGKGLTDPDGSNYREV